MARAVEAEITGGPRDAIAAERESQPGRAVRRNLGVTDYLATWEAMRAFTDTRTDDTPDELWITEHPPVYTLGIAGREAHLPRFDNGIPLIRTDRGGQITYHGPGQIVVYTLVNLPRAGLNVRSTVRALENAVVDVLSEHGVGASGDVARPGVYVRGEKIASVGLKIRRGCSYHGVAFNVDMDLAPFGVIDPCGYPELGVTDARRLGVAAPIETLATALAGRLEARLYD